MSDDALDDRKAAILRAVVAEYIETAQPVGSQHVASAQDVAVSPATVRNEMAVLEREGYLAQPHTSAGRIPTDKGYRFFVDHLDAPGPLGPAQRQQVREFFSKATGELETVLKSTSRLLSNLTDHAAVVVAPAHDAASVRSVQLVALGPRICLAVAVLANGVVEKRTLELDADVTDDRVVAAGGRVAAAVLGRPVTNPEAPLPTGDAATDALVASTLDALRSGHDAEPDSVFVGGTARLAQGFDAVTTVREVLSLLEQQYVVVRLLSDVLDRGLSVAIGSETGLVPLAECSVVVAPYEVDGEPSGTIGILGPTRMNYQQAMAAVAVVGNRLGQRLSEG